MNSQRADRSATIADSRPSIKETLYLLRSPKNAERLLEAVRGFEAGEAKTIDLE